MQASLTGHLVFSTLHTNDAAGTIPRLVDLGVDPASVAPALSMAIAQRLVRKVCPQCHTMASPAAAELEEIKNGLKNLPGNVEVPDIGKNFKIAKTKGCDICNNTGYKGRKGLYEAFLIDKEMQRFILTNPAVSDLKDMAIKKGMVTMYQSGLIEVANGTTTLDEVKRVVEAD